MWLKRLFLDKEGKSAYKKLHSLDKKINFSGIRKTYVVGRVKRISQEIFFISVIVFILGVLLFFYVGGPSIHSYIIFTNGTNIYAKDGRTGAIDYKGTNATIVIQNALNTLDNNLESGKKHNIYFEGNFTVTQINIKNNTVLDIRAAKIFSSGNAIPFVLSGINNSEIIGGIIDCNSQKHGDIQMRCISLLNTENIIIDGTEVRNGGYYGINLWQSSNSTIKNAYSHNNYVDGIHLGSDTAGRGWYNNVQNSTFNNNGMSGLSDRGSSIANEKLYNAYDSITAVQNGGLDNEWSRGVYISGNASIDAVFTLTNINASNNVVHGITIENCSVFITNITVNNNIKFGLRLRAVRNSYMKNINVNDNGNRSNFGAGVSIEDLYDLSSANISVYGGQVMRNWENLRVYSKTNTSHDITFDSIDATEGILDNVYISGATNVTLPNTLY